SVGVSRLGSGVGRTDLHGRGTCREPHPRSADFPAEPCVDHGHGRARGRVRYRLPDAVRAYAAERLAEAGEEDLFQERLLSRMFHLLEDLNDKLESSRVVPWSERDAARKRVLAEYETLRALVARAQEQRDVESGL